MNVGYLEALSRYNFQCAIFHDVDLLTENDRNLYTCPEQPRHMSVAIDKFDYKLPYEGIFGGVTAMTVEQMTKMNGYSNDFWGWGGEDDEVRSRVALAGYKVVRYRNSVARYQMIKHKRDRSNPTNGCRLRLMYKVKTRYQHDGLNNIQYKVVDSALKSTHIWVKVDLLEDQSQAALNKEGVCAKH